MTYLEPVKHNARQNRSQAHSVNSWETRHSYCQKSRVQKAPSRHFPLFAQKQKKPIYHREGEKPEYANHRFYAIHHISTEGETASL